MDALKHYIKEVTIYSKPLTEEEEKALTERVKQGDPKARDELIQRNLRLVISLARHYGGMGLSFPDLIAEGNVGLLRAVDKFDPSLGYRFSTYAAWWIKQAIIKALVEASSLLHIPAYISQMLQKLKLAEKELAEKLGRSPDVKDIAKKLGTTVARVGQLMKAKESVSSLNVQIAPNSDYEIIDLLTYSDVGVDPKEEIDNKLHAEAIISFINEMPEKERYVLNHRFGIETGKPKTLQEIADELGLSREGVRVVEKKAIERLRSFLEKELSMIEEGIYGFPEEEDS